jgi:tyrosine-protein phosphatase SIW14
VVPARAKWHGWQPIIVDGGDNFNVEGPAWYTPAMLHRACLAALALAGGCAFPAPPPPRALDGLSLRRLDRVDESLYRGSQPSRAEFAELVKRYHIRTVIKLNPTFEGSDELPDGVKLIHEPLSAVVVPGAADLRRILDEIDAAEKPVYVHCRHGEDRTGLVVALYRVRHGARPEDAYADMMLHAFHPYRGVWGAWVREVGWTGSYREPSAVAAGTSAQPRSVFASP